RPPSSRDGHRQGPCFEGPVRAIGLPGDRPVGEGHSPAIVSGRPSQTARRNSGRAENGKTKWKGLTPEPARLEVSMTPTEVPKHETVLHTRDAQIARVYAEALLNVATRQQKAEVIMAQLHLLVHDLFPAQPLFEKFLSSRAIQRHQKEQLIRSTLEKNIDPRFLDFVLVLNRHDRLALLRAIW